MKHYYQIEGTLRNNIGDVLQGYVAKRLLPSETRQVVDREALGDLDNSEPSFLIANGWYMHSFDRFPPSEMVTPLYIAVHVAQSDLLHRAEVREHFKQHAPIGCRDVKTQRLFLGWGIPAYYSGCLTITTDLPEETSSATDGEILLVDGVDHPVPDSLKTKLETLHGSEIIRITHDPPNPEGDFDEYASRAEKHLHELLSRYRNAKLIITTKIHCALPCLGMGCNVCLIHPNIGDPRLETVQRYIKAISFDELQTREQPLEAEVDVAALNRSRKFISQLVSDSVRVNGNIVRTSFSPKYLAIRVKSVVMASACRILILSMFALGSASASMKRAYQSE